MAWWWSENSRKLRSIVRKPGFVRNCGCKLQKTNWFGRGGGDRKQCRLATLLANVAQLIVGIIALGILIRNRK